MTQADVSANEISYEGGPAREVTGPATDLPGEQVPFFLDAGKGRQLLVAGQLNTRLITSRETDGKMTAAVMEGGPEESPVPAHQHEREDHLFFILEGKIRVWVGEQQRVLQPGDCAYLPAGLPHSYRFEASHNKFLSISTPGGFETFFELVGQPVDAPAPAGGSTKPSAEKMRQAALEHDWHPVPDYDFGI